MKKFVILLLACFLIAGLTFVSCNSEVKNSTVSVSFAPATTKAINQSGTVQSTDDENVSLYHWEYAYVQGDSINVSDSLAWTEFYTDKSKAGLGNINGLVKNSTYSFALRGYTTGTDGVLMWEGATESGTLLSSKKTVITIHVNPKGKGMIYFDIDAPVFSTEITTSGTDYTCENNDKFKISWIKLGDTTVKGEIFKEGSLNTDGDAFEYNTVGKEALMLDSGSYLFTIQQYEYNEYSSDTDYYDAVTSRKQVLIVDAMSGMDTVLSGSLDSEALTTFNYNAGAAGDEYGIEVEFKDGDKSGIKNLDVKIKNESGETRSVDMYETVYVKDKSYVYVDFSDATEEVNIYVNGEQVYFTSDSDMVENDYFGSGSKFYLKDYDSEDSEAIQSSNLKDYDSTAKTVKAYAKKDFTYLVTITSGKLSKTFSIVGLDDSNYLHVMSKTLSEYQLALKGDNAVILEHNIVSSNPVDFEVTSKLQPSEAERMLDEFLGDNKSDNPLNNVLTLTLTVKDDGISYDSANLDLELKCKVQVFDSDNTETFKKENVITEAINDFVEVEIQLPTYRTNMVIKHSGYEMTSVTDLSSVTTATDDPNNAGFYNYNAKTGILTLKVRKFSPFIATYDAPQNYTVTYYDSDGSLIDSDDTIVEGAPLPYFIYKNSDDVVARWKTSDADDAPLWDYDTPVSGSIELYALYSSEKIKVYYEWNNNSTVAHESYFHSLDHEYLSSLKNTIGTYNYNVMGEYESWYRVDWYKDEALTDKWDMDNDLVTEEVTLWHDLYPYVKNEPFNPVKANLLTNNIWSVGFVKDIDVYRARIVDGKYATAHDNSEYPLQFIMENKIGGGTFTITLDNDEKNNQWGYKILHTQGVIESKLESQDYIVVTPKPLKSIRIYENYSQDEGTKHNISYSEGDVSTNWEDRKLVGELTGVGDSYTQGNEFIYIEPVYNCKVTFISSEGTTIATQTVESHTKLTSPTDSMNTVSAWYTDAELTNKYDFNSYVWDDITLYAKNIITGKSGQASCKTTSGRSSCEWVQLWEGGPRWATFNVGATVTSYDNLPAGTDPGENDNYTFLGREYNWGSTVYTNHNVANMEYACTSTTDIQFSSYDTAKNIWGNNWQMPTKDQLGALLQNCEITLCDGDATKFSDNCILLGYKFTGKGDYSQNSIFLPFVDDTYNQYFVEVMYWSSTFDTFNGSAPRASDLRFTKLYSDFTNPYITNLEIAINAAVRPILVE